ncbi:hypothetical protein, partial [Sporosarcina sp. NCCP-2716]|uniref:hypothetical protein n=1 Tax=Sporosarcina sp. NCCP-2716 TaxID=2943679 RepID=UPI00203B502C
MTANEYIRKSRSLGNVSSDRERTKWTWRGDRELSYHPEVIKKRSAGKKGSALLPESPCEAVVWTKGAAQRSPPFNLGFELRKGEKCR